MQNEIITKLQNSRTYSQAGEPRIYIWFVRHHVS